MCGFYGLLRVCVGRNWGVCFLIRARMTRSDDIDLWNFIRYIVFSVIEHYLLPVIEFNVNIDENINGKHKNIMNTQKLTKYINWKVKPKKMFEKFQYYSIYSYGWKKIDLRCAIGRSLISSSSVSLVEAEKEPCRGLKWFSLFDDTEIYPGYNRFRIASWRLSFFLINWNVRKLFSI